MAIKGSAVVLVTAELLISGFAPSNRRSSPVSLEFGFVSVMEAAGLCGGVSLAPRTGSARETLGVGGSDSVAALDGAGAAAAQVRIVEAGGTFKAVISCESLERSVFDELGGLDFAI